MHADTTRTEQKVEENIPNRFILPQDASFQELDHQELIPALEKTDFKRVQLIYPAFEMETGKNRKETFLSAVLPPLGMLYVAAEIEKAGYDVSVIDAEAERLNDDQTFNQIQDDNYPF